MKKVWCLFCTVIALLCFTSCENTPDEKYFFVAGHAYGNPNSPQYGLYPPLMTALEEIQLETPLEMGFLTGDVVVQPTEAYWDSAMKDIESLDMPIYIAAGNHDKGEEFDRRFGKAYSSFISDDDLFIILAPSNWNIEGEQLRFLKNTLDDHSTSCQNIFLFIHELIWWHPDDVYGDIDINWRPHFPGETNFWTEVSPLLIGLENEIYIFAGDLGATQSTSPYMYDQRENLHLIASGLGSGNRDNLLLVDYTDEEVHIHQYWLKEDGSMEITDLIETH
ncbi:MAG: hypothetical protein HKN79_03400 [Flavobacteriales bacterium]|nr:hypothetical protein [Flavobacteriales bacterium]